MKYMYLGKHLFSIKRNKYFYLIQTYPFKIFLFKDKKQLTDLKRRLIKNYSNLIKNKDRDYSNYFSLELILTSMCNLACNYCYAKREDVGYYGLPRMNMGRKTAKMAIDFSLKQLLSNMKINKSKNGIFDIYFMGGEPLLNKNTLVFAMNYLKNKIKNLQKNIKIDLQAAISTNGTLVDNNISKFFEKFDFTYVGVTIDGEKHNEYRVYQNGGGTLSDIKKGIKLLEKCGVNIKLVSVVPPGDISKIDNILEFYKKEGLLDIAFRVSIVPRAPSLHELNRTCIIPKKFLEEYINKRGNVSYTKREKDLFSNKIIEISEKFDVDERDIKKKIFQTIKLGGFLHHCPAGICKISITPDGSIYPCHQLVNINRFYMGNLNERRKKLYAKIKNIFLDRTVFKLDKCGKCLFQTICPPLVDCPARSYYEEKSLYKTPQYCNMYYKYIEKTFGNFLDDIKPEVTKYEKMEKGL